MSYSERLLVVSRSFAVCHFGIGFFLFVMGWQWGFTHPILFGIPVLGYGFAITLSRQALRGWSWRAFYQKIVSVPRLPFFVIFIFFLLNFLFCLLPPAENLESDALNYHLAIPWQYYLRGGVVPLDWSISDKYPLYFQLAQLPFQAATFPWILKIWNIFVLPGILLVLWNWLNSFGFTKNAICWTVAMTSGLALLGKQYGTAMFDLLHAFYILLGLFYLVRAAQFNKRDDLLWGGVILGMACSAKSFLIYYALLWGIAFLIWKITLSGEKVKKFDLTLMTAPLAAAVFLLAPVWIRNMLLLGNPFFPLFLNFLGPEVEAKGIYIVMQNALTQRGYGRSLLDFFLGPIRFVFPFPRKFDYWTDPILLLFLIGVFFHRKSEWKTTAGLVGLLAFFCYVAFFFLSQEARYLYPFWILVMVLGVGWVFKIMREKIRNGVLIAQTLLGIGSLLFFHREAVGWLQAGAVKHYLENASYSYVWNAGLKGILIQQLCLRNVTGNYVRDILYFTVPVKLVQHFNTMYSLKNPFATEGCDYFMIGNQAYNSQSRVFQEKGQLVSKEEFLTLPKASGE